MSNPIQPVKVIAASDLEENGGVYLVQKGIPAIPVHGFTAQGNRAVKGVARPVYVVSEAEFNASDFVKAHGQPQPVGDIDDLGFVGALEGREAIPVWAVNDWPSSGVVPFVGAYDDIPNLVHVYEPARRTLTSYTGPLVRIRRSSDNAEQDFGYVANGDLDTAAITTFLGGSSGFVVTVYDQVGGRNITNSTAGQQPNYSMAGLGGLPTVEFTGNDILVTAAGNNISINNNALTVFCLSSILSQDSVVDIVVEMSSDANVSDGFWLATSTVATGGAGARINGTTGQNLSVANPWNGTGVARLMIIRGNAATPQNNLYRDGVSIASGVVNFGTIGSDSLNVGSRRSLSLPANARISSVIICNAALSNANVNIVGNNISAKYGTAWSDL